MLYELVFRLLIFTWVVNLEIIWGVHSHGQLTEPSFHISDVHSMNALCQLFICFRFSLLDWQNVSKDNLVHQFFLALNLQARLMHWIADRTKYLWHNWSNSITFLCLPLNQRVSLCWIIYFKHWLFFLILSWFNERNKTWHYLVVGAGKYFFGLNKINYYKFCVRMLSA